MYGPKRKIKFAAEFYEPVILPGKPGLSLYFDSISTGGDYSAELAGLRKALNTGGYCALTEFAQMYCVVVEAKDTVILPMIDDYVQVSTSAYHYQAVIMWLIQGSNQLYAIISQAQTGDACMQSSG